MPSSSELRSLNQEFFVTAERYRDRVAFARSDPDRARPLTYAALRRRVEALAAGLLTLDLRPGTRVALVAHNRADWYVADRAVLLAGGIDVPQPADLGAGALEAVLRHSGSRIAVVEGE